MAVLFFEDRQYNEDALREYREWIRGMYGSVDTTGKGKLNFNERVILFQTRRGL